ncbi:FtsK/SpoIIIE domain-containing protein [Tsukamurella sp. 8F]|uniref:FtsK/SpoIIIE domain-containing protein n=1 Tax=unclassified Tsukamurella TaxID=2633480 RepID=UPI0023B96DCD|nr:MULTISPECIES: FtsK/SpoIIIE domain-containing protein [unclassified Tsukamurella]MDF0529783.1 FtsK/SpoIIIE domain-containing protein [Tsukamurella sp. 8J]MDF0586975.1 FtsK/SpoIIIE domain-containing protein [Tsukamurella sp. 8F]
MATVESLFRTLAVFAVIVMVLIVTVTVVWIAVVHAVTSRVTRPAVADFDAAVADAVASLRLDSGSVFRACGLSRRDAVGRRDGRVVYDFVDPRVLSIRPSPFGASVTVAPWPGLATCDFERQRDALSHALGVAVTVRSPSAGTVVLDLRVVDPLATPKSLDHVPFWDGRWTLPIGVDEAGASVSLSLTNVSGVVVGGVPGAGKSAWLIESIASLATSHAVVLLTIDGKGGADLAPLERRAAVVLGDDLEAVRDLLREVEAVRNWRVKRLPSWHGTSNLWDVGPSRDWPIILVVIDECQSFLDPRAAVSRDDKSVVVEVTSLVSSLIRRGRSAGIVTILATQKPTADSIPTGIRDNCSRRVAFGVSTRDAATAVLGDGWAEADVRSPLNLPVGVCVHSDGAGGLGVARAPYVPPGIVADHCREIADQARSWSDIHSEATSFEEDQK